MLKSPTLDRINLEYTSLTRPHTITLEYHAGYCVGKGSKWVTANNSLETCFNRFKLFQIRTPLQKTLWSPSKALLSLAPNPEWPALNSQAVTAIFSPVEVLRNEIEDHSTLKQNGCRVNGCALCFACAGAEVNHLENTYLYSVQILTSTLYIAKIDLHIHNDTSSINLKHSEMMRYSSCSGEAWEYQLQYFCSAASNGTFSMSAIILMIACMQGKCRAQEA